jgi:3',5'-cyclic AMP phosphodiesterase CpdA
MVRLAHISDLHFGAIDPKAQAALKASIDAAKPNAVIVTGDLTQAGRRREFAEAARFLESLDFPLLVTPGNHDAPVYNVGLRMADPWRRFRRILGAETDAVLEIAGATIVGLNSARRGGISFDWSRGRLSAEQIGFAATELRSAPHDDLRVVALHHPVLPGPGRAGAYTVARAKAALAMFAEARADLILTGHVHVAEASIHETAGRPMIVARAGTATSTRLRGEAPSYNLIALVDGGLAVAVHRFADNGYEEIAARRFERASGCWRDAVA